MPTMRFGVTLPQIKRTFDQTRDAAQTLDELGFHSVWACDHLYGVPIPSLPIFEAWTLLSAVAAVTRRVELGTLVTPVGFRNPALLAKQIATLDNISGGRVLPGLGVGWFEPEFLGHGLKFPPVKERLEQLEEAVVLLRRMWTEPQVTHAGKHFETRNVYCEPKPLRRPPVLIGGSGEKTLLRIVARHADVWNNLGIHQSSLSHKVRVLHEHCAAVGRDPSEITISQQAMCVLGADAADAEAKRQKAAAIYGGHLGEGLAGTPDEVIAQIRRLADAGCSLLVLELFGKDVREPARLFAERVMPAFA